MASSVNIDAHGVRVMTQTIPLQNPEPTQCFSEKKDNKTKLSEVPYMTKMFLKGEPVALGTVQIMVGIVMIGIGAISWFTQTLYGEIPVGLGLSFIISGSVTLGAHKGTSSPVIKSVIALNIISALLAISAVCYFCFAFTIEPKFSACQQGEIRYYDCQYVTIRLMNLLIAVKGILLGLSVFGACVCTTTVVFSCKARKPLCATKWQVVGVQSNSSSKEALLNSEVASPPLCDP
ncbi:membrane-spanning 4-domains subfamily A member 4D-like [Silurus meridionalis]|uniref:Membrane-spanning 4-domains subfamily A member 4A-like n=1 Tax=Silurus meridionalis TaxID=175797 RepID=A0A8T0BMJ8_SILME|nr:membrane-spanning 4-domains subfamily A member 4D-like [Silurus meridionalis]KAF7708512.1 hypothetical protein HF521_017569 [Silurus meridionalis]